MTFLRWIMQWNQPNVCYIVFEIRIDLHEVESIYGQHDLVEEEH